MTTASPQHSNPLSPRRDRRAATSTVRWRREVPEAIRSLGALADSDCADIVTATVDETPTDPDQTVQAVLKNLPRGLVLFVPFVQRVFLGLRLKLRPSTDHLLGWKIAERGETWIRIEAASWFLTGHVVIHADEGVLSSPRSSATTDRSRRSSGRRCPSFTAKWRSPWYAARHAQ